MATRGIDTNSGRRSPILTCPPTFNSPGSSAGEETSTCDHYDGGGNSNEPLRGWPLVARLMATTPEFAAFPRFRDLHIKSLLYYQVQLTEVRDRLDEVEREDHYTGNYTVKKYAEDARWLVYHDTCHGPTQWNLVLRMRRLLTEYDEALLKYSQIAALPEPDAFNIESFRVWLKRKEGGDYCIKGPAADAWGDPYESEKAQGSLLTQLFHLIRYLFWARSSPPQSDLVAMQSSPSIDGFTCWVANELVPFYQNCKNSLRKMRIDDEERAPSKSVKERKHGVGIGEFEGSVDTRSTLETYSGSRILKFTAAFATLTACLLPTVAIAVLSTVHETRNRLLYIGGFTAIFAIGLIFLTDAATSRVQIFMATAAFSAVMVVFVQNA